MTSLTLDRNTRKHLTAYRRDLTDALVANDSEATEIALRKLLQVESSLKHKCRTISVATILNTNCRNPSNWDQVSKALGILERYATNLLKPEDQRPKGWEAIMTKNDIFIKRINPIVGAREILSIIGYSRREEDSLKLVGEPNTDRLQMLRVDLKIAKCEMDLYQNKSHPFPQRLDELVQEEARIAQDPSKQSLVIQSLPPPPTSSWGSLSSLPAPTSAPTSAAYQSPQITSPSSENAPPSAATSAPPSTRASPPKVLPKPVRANQDRNQNQAIQDRNQSYNNQRNQANSHQMSPGGQYGNQSLPPVPVNAYSSPPRGPGAPYGGSPGPGYPGPPHAPQFPGAPRGPQSFQGSPLVLGQPPAYQNQPPPYFQCQRPYINTPEGRVSTYGPPGPPQQAWPAADMGPQAPHSARRPAPPVPVKPVIDLHARGPERGAPVEEKKFPDSPGVRAEASAPPLYPVLPTPGDELLRGDWFHLSEPGESSSDSFGLPGRDEGRELGKEEKPGFFSKWWNKMFGSNSVEEGEELHEPREEPRGQPRGQPRDHVWPGTSIKIPSTATDLLREKDPVRRYQNLESIITALDLEAQKFDEQIEQILAAEREYRKNKEYQKLTQLRDDLKRELILLKRVRQDVQRAGVQGGSAEVAQRLARPVDQPRPDLPGSNQPLPAPQRPRSAQYQSRDYDAIRQEDQVKRGLDTKGVWACQHCTSHNPMTADICQICSKTADVKDKVAEPEVKVEEPEVKVDEQEDGYHTPREETDEFMVIGSDGSVTAVGAADGGAQISPSQGSPAGAPLGAGEPPGEGASLGGPLGAGEPPGEEAPAPVDMDQILDWMMVCEEDGYSVQQFKFALRAITNNHSRVSPRDWLHKNWPMMIDLVQADLKESPELGKFSAREIETALEESDTSKINVIVDHCRNTRTTLVESLVETYGSLPRDRILATLTQYHGSERDTCRALNELVMRPLLAELGTSQERRLEDKELREMISKSTFDREARLMTLMAERHLTESVAVDVLAIVGDSLLDPDDTTDDLSLTEIIEAATSCSSVDQTLDHLQRPCHICATLFPENRMRSMFVCDCKMCMECMLQHFTIKVRESPATEFTCPLCHRPDMENELELTYVHFQMLDNQLKQSLERVDYERYQAKVLDWRLVDPNFRWCQSDQCKEGFVVDAELIKAQQYVTCPKCRVSTCHTCNKKWEAAHDGITCEEFAKWQEDNNPDTNQQAMETMLREDGIKCPNPACTQRYVLARGGCQHFVCRTCKHQFCSGCYQPMNKKCRKFKGCVNRGIHSHHPRNCFTNLRDHTCETLIDLLENNGHPVGNAAPLQGAEYCTVPEQKEKTHRNGNMELVDEPCGRELYNNTNQCVVHYKEFLVNRVNQYHIDPVVIMEEGKLRGHLMENEIEIPANYAAMTTPEREQRLRQLVRDSLPLHH